MDLLKRWIVLGAALCACDGGSTLVDAGGMDASADAGTADASSNPDAGPMVHVFGVVTGPGGGTLEGARIADGLHPEIPAVETDVDGLFDLALPAGVPVLIDVQYTGLLSLLLPVPPLTDDFPNAQIALPSRAEVDARVAPLGVTTEPGKAILAASSVDEAFMPLPGVEFEIEPAQEIYYAVEMGMLSDQIAETRAAGFAQAIDVSPTPPEISIRARAVSGRPCAAVPGWRGATDDELRAPVRADTITVANFMCATPTGRRLVAGSVLQYRPGMPQSMWPVLEDAEVCVLDDAATPCSASRTSGFYAIDVPDDPEVALTYSAPGRQGILTALRNEGPVINRNVGLPETAYVDGVLAAYGASQSAANGSIEFFSTPMVTATVTPASGQGPFYLGPGSTNDPTLTSASSQGWGFFFDLSPGEVEVHFDHPTQACTALGAMGWTATSSEAVRTPIVAGYLSFISLRCP